MDGRGGLPAGDGGPYAAALPRLMQETELQKMLADEKMRSEQHKTHYQMLKAEHTRLSELNLMQTNLVFKVGHAKLYMRGWQGWQRLYFVAPSPAIMVTAVMSVAKSHYRLTARVFLLVLCELA